MVTLRYKKIKTISKIKELSYAEQTTFYRGTENLLYRGRVSPEDIHDLMVGNKKYATLISESQKKKTSLVEKWQKCWEFANEENHDEAHNTTFPAASTTDKEDSWEEARTYFYEFTIKSKVSEKELQEVRDKAKLQEHFSIKEDFLKLFSKKSYLNEIIGECLFYSFITVLLRKKGVRIENKNSMEDSLINPLLFFVSQDSGTGKDQALDFLQELIKEMNRILTAKKRLDLLIRCENLSGGETPEVYFSRPEMNAKGQMKFDKNNELSIIPGKLECNDVLLVRECSFLFRIKGKERQNILEILLQVLEGREIKKTLVSWGKHVVATRSNCAYIGMSRPVKEIQEVITNSGLLQRGLFYGREVNREEREKMDDMLAGNIDKEQYRKAFRALANKMTEFYTNIDAEEFIMKDSGIGKELLRSYKKEKRNYIYDEIKSELIQNVLNTFINRLDETSTKLSYVNCYARGGSIPDETDIQSSLNILGKMFTNLVAWLDVSLKDDGRQNRQNLERRVKMFFEKKGVAKQSEIVKFIAGALGCTNTTARAKFHKNFVGKNKLFTDVGDKRFLYNKEGA